MLPPVSPEAFPPSEPPVWPDSPPPVSPPELPLWESPSPELLPPWDWSGFSGWLLSPPLPEVPGSVGSVVLESPPWEPELLELKRVYGAQAARRFPPVPQLRSRGAAKTEDETEFLI